jgi:hypothetical protein
MRLHSALSHRHYALSSLSTCNLMFRRVHQMSFFQGWQSVGPCREYTLVPIRPIDLGTRILSRPIRDPKCRFMSGFFLRWVFRIKRDEKGKFEKYKCIIVVKGYSQVAGLDFNETFAPVVRIESLRVIFTITAANGIYMLHIDCKNASLHGESDVEIYVTQPEGFEDNRCPQKVLHLNKSLYGLTQAPRIWYLFLCGVVSELGFVAPEWIPAFVFEGKSFSQFPLTTFKWLAKPKKAAMLSTKNWRNTSKSNTNALSQAFWASTSSEIGMNT